MSVQRLEGIPGFSIDRVAAATANNPEVLRLENLDTDLAPPAAALPVMAEHTITIGSVSKEYRMIGWRIGWVVGPQEIIDDIARVHIYNVVTPTGIAQAAACAALQSPEEEFDACLAEWQRRRDVVVEQLRDLPITAAAGGWSLLLNVGEMGYDSMTASRLLLERGKVAATPMRHWGQRNSDQFVRLVFSNEPVDRLASLRKRVAQALWETGIGEQRNKGRT